MDLVIGFDIGLEFSGFTRLFIVPSEWLSRDSNSERVPMGVPEC